MSAASVESQTNQQRKENAITVWYMFPISACITEANTHIPIIQKKRKNLAPVALKNGLRSPKLTQTCKIYYWAEF